MTREGFALLGASDRTPWSHWLLHNVRAQGWPGPVWAVHPRLAEASGVPCYPSVADLPGRVAIGAVALRAELVEQATRDLLTAGARTVLVISNGFRETGDAEGARREDRLRAMCAEAGALLLGPNCSGFAHYDERLCAIAQPVPAGLTAGDVSVVSQSGALLSGVLEALHRDGLGVDRCYSIGNGAAFDLTRAVASVTARPTTRVLCLIVEGVAEPDRLAAAIGEARAGGRHVIVLKLGASTVAREVARSHTGAVVGEGRLVRAWLERAGATVVNSIDLMARLAALTPRTPAASDQGVFLLAGSGGAAALAGDLAEQHGLALARPSAGTLARLRELLPPTAHLGNPLDLVGGAPATRGAIYQAVCADPGVGAVLEAYTIAWPDASDGRRWHRAGMEGLAAATAATGTPVVLAPVFQQPPTDWLDDFRRRTGVRTAADLETTVAALARLYPAARDAAPAGAVVGEAAGAVIGEAAGRVALAAAGIDVVPGGTATGVEEALAQARALTPPVVVKTAADIPHKGRVGGVRVGLRTPEEIRVACADIDAAVRAAGLEVDGRPAGFLVQQMVSGPEILVGLVRDEVAGPTVNIGVGGWAAELSAPAVTLALPTTPADLAAAITGGGLGRALGGDAAGLVDIVQRLCAAFVDGALRDYEVVECNPVILTADGPRVVDVLLIPHLAPSTEG